MLTPDPPPDPGPAEERFDPSLLEEWDETGWWADLAAAGSAAAAEATGSPAAAAAAERVAVGRGDLTAALSPWQRMVGVFPFEPDREHPGLDEQALRLLARLHDAEALRSQLEAEQARLLRQLRAVRLVQQAAAHPHDGGECTRACCDEDGWVAAEVGPQLGLSERQVGSRIDTALLLAGHPAVEAALDAGRLQAWTATRLLEHLDILGAHVTGERLAVVEAATLAWLLAGPRTVAQLNTRMRRLILAARAAAGGDGGGGSPAGPDDGGLEPGHRQRGVTITPSPTPGLGELVALLPDADALAIRATLMALAHDPVDVDDPRTADQRRADLLVTLLTGRPALNGRPDDQRCALRDPVDLAIRLDLTLPADTLRGGDQPAHIPGYGDVPATTTHDLTRTATAGAGARCQLRPLVYHPDTGRLLGFGAAPVPMTWLADLHPSPGYQHPPTLHTAIQLRDGTCRAPACPRPATHCDCDHVIPYPTGPTSLANSCSLCRRHHRLKTHAPGWHLSIHPDGHTTWTTPTNHTITTHPTDYRPPDTDPDNHPDTDPPPF